MAKKPGVGYVLPPGSRAVWIGNTSVLDPGFPINLAGTTYAERYGHDESFGEPQGMANENHGNNEKALRHWYAAQSAAHRAEWDGEPTDYIKHTGWETSDLAFTQPRRGGLYAVHWWPFEPGSSRETAVVVDKSNWKTESRNFPRGIALGVQAKRTALGYLKWWDVRYKPAGYPDPLPPPTVGADAEFWAQSAGGFVAGKVKSVNERDETVKFAAPNGASATYSLDDGPSADMPQGRLWRLKGGAVPTPAPAPAPTPTPAPAPKPTPAPEIPAFSDGAMRTFDLAPKWLEGQPGRIARLSRLAREAQAIQAAILAARGK